MIFFGGGCFTRRLSPQAPCSYQFTSSFYPRERKKPLFSPRNRECPSPEGSGGARLLHPGSIIRGTPGIPPGWPRGGREAEPAGGSGFRASTGGLGATNALRTLINDPIAAPCGLQGKGKGRGRDKGRGMRSRGGQQQVRALCGFAIRQICSALLSIF